MNVKHYFLLASLALALLASLAGCQRQNQAAMTNQQTEQAVRAVLDAQVQAWNRGDIEGFMQGYAKSDETVFVSGDNVTRGWQTVLDRYKKNYDSPEKMGKLEFSELEIKPVGEDGAVALGRWRLTRTGDTPHGRFTLIFRRTPDGWRIIHDHTS